MWVGGSEDTDTGTWNGPGVGVTGDVGEGREYED